MNEANLSKQPPISASFEDKEEGEDIPAAEIEAFTWSMDESMGLQIDDKISDDINIDLQKQQQNNSLQGDAFALPVAPPPEAVSIEPESKDNNSILDA